MLVGGIMKKEELLKLMKNRQAKDVLVKQAIRTLSYDEKKNFGISCLDRIINLYEDVDSRIDISEADDNIKKGTANNTLISIYKDLKHSKATQLDDIKNKIKICDSLILDTEEIFDNSVKNIAAGIVAENLYYLLKFEIEEDNQYIFDCSTNQIEVINQIMSEYFFEHVSNNENVCDELLEVLFVKEYDIQLQAINLIKDRKKYELNELIKETIIYNKSVE